MPGTVGMDDERLPGGAVWVDGRAKEVEEPNDSGRELDNWVAEGLGLEVNGPVVGAPCSPPWIKGQKVRRDT